MEYDINEVLIFFKTQSIISLVFWSYCGLFILAKCHNRECKLFDFCTYIVIVSYLSVLVSTTTIYSFPTEDLPLIFIINIWMNGIIAIIIAIMFIVMILFIIISCINIFLESEDTEILESGNQEFAVVEPQTFIVQGFITNIPPNDKCSICLENPKPDDIWEKLNCGHKFHVNCISVWFNYNNYTCPICRESAVFIIEPIIQD